MHRVILSYDCKLFTLYMSGSVDRDFLASLKFYCCSFLLDLPTSLALFYGVDLSSSALLHKILMNSFLQLHLSFKYLSWMICADGITIITIKKLTGMIIAAKIPNARIGLMSERALERKAMAVVLDVTRIALKERLKL